MDRIPDPNQLHPSTRADLTNVVFLNNEVTSLLIEVGDYTYYDNEGNLPLFERANVKYLYGPQRLVIGRFTSVGPGSTFLMPGGNHPLAGSSTYPFTMFGGVWAETRWLRSWRSNDPATLSSAATSESDAKQPSCPGSRSATAQ